MLSSTDLAPGFAGQDSSVASSAAAAGRSARAAGSGAGLLLSSVAADSAERRLALGVVAVSALFFLAAVPFAKMQLAAVPAFIPLYQSALVISDLLTAALLFAQFRILRSRALLVLASAYLFTACITVSHTLSFPGLFAPGGLLGAGPQTTAWLYMFWHGGFSLLIVAYAFMKDNAQPAGGRGAMLATAAVLGVVCAFTLLTTAGAGLLPAVMQGNGYTPALLFVVSSVWALSALALAALWRRRPHSALDLWLMVVMCAWLFDIGLAAVFNQGRFDLGFYAGRIYGLLAATFVLVMLLVENTRLHAQLITVHEGARRSLTQHAERLRVLHSIDRAVLAGESPEAIAAAVVEPLRELLGVPRAIVNRFDLTAGQVEWVAAAGRRRVHSGSGVRYSLALMGDLEALKRGETQVVDTRSVPPGPDADALLASGVDHYMVVPMIAAGELVGALSFGGKKREFLAEQRQIGREIAAQLSIAMSMAKLVGAARVHAAELEQRVLERTATLRQSEERFRLVVEAVRDYAIFMLDPQGTVVSWNAGAERFKGYRAEEIIGQHFSRFYPEEDKARSWPQQELAHAATHGVAKDEGWRVRKDGTRFWASVVITALRDEQGRLRGFSKITRDLTLQKEADDSIEALTVALQARAAELEAVNKELSSFSYSVSHDLRAPLRAIDGYGRILEEDYAARLDDEGRRLLGVVRDSSRQMGRLIDDLLEFARLGRQTPAKRALDMTALAREVADQAAQGTPTVVEIAPLPAGAADRALLKQVWINLIGNAVKYSSKNSAPRVEIGGCTDGEEHIYWVRDNGAGFDMRYAAKLFGVFQRLHGQDEFPGTGVGLAIVQRVVTRHGGRAWAEAEVGKGACFFFSLPVAG
jgi:PAS domain S-box-containing protein